MPHLFTAALKIQFSNAVRSGKHSQALFFVNKTDELINSVSLSLEMNLTCYSGPISPWRILRVKSSKFMTPVWHGWMVRIAGVWLLPDKVLMAVKVPFNNLGWNWAAVLTAVQSSMLPWIYAVALLTHNSLLQNCPNLLRKRSGSPYQRGTHPLVQPQQQPHHDSPGKQLLGEFQRSSTWGQRTDFSIDWLMIRDSWTNCPANGEEKSCFQIEWEKLCRALLYHIPQLRQKKIWQGDSISSFSPSLAPLWALNMCLQREFSKQGYHFEHRLCATLTDLYGSSPRSVKRGCVVRFRKSLSSTLWYGVLSMLLPLIKWYDLSWNSQGGS